jgi:hypothetical protein
MFTFWRETTILLVVVTEPSLTTDQVLKGPSEEMVFPNEVDYAIS